MDSEDRYNIRDEIVREFRSKYDPDMTYSDLISLSRIYTKKIKEVIGLISVDDQDVELMYLSRMYNNGRYDSAQIFQFFNKEFNDGLALHLQGFKNILEVGCGNGMLTYVLRKRGLPITGCDDFSWGQSPVYINDVLKLDYQKAIEKVQPDCVISCWMPWQADWTIDFRKEPCIKSYFLIGEDKNGCTSSDESFKNRKGWKRLKLINFYEFNLCRTDYLFGTWNSKHGAVYQFRRKSVVAKSIEII